MTGSKISEAGGAPRRATVAAPVRVAGAGIVVFAAAYCSIALTRNDQHLSTFWFASPVLLAFLLRNPTRLWAFLLVSGFLGQVAAQLLVSDPPFVMVVSATLNMLEVLAIAAGVRRWIGHDIDLSRLPHLAVFVLIGGILAPMGESTLAAILLSHARHVPPLVIWTTWYPVLSLGCLVFTPPLLMPQHTALALLWQADRRLETVAWFTGLVAVCGAAFLQSSYPLLFMPMAVLALVAVRLGPAGSTFGIGFVAVSAALATLHGYGPVMLTSGDPTTRSFVLQGFTAALVLSNLPLTALLSDLARLDAKAREANRRLTFAETIAQMGHWRLDLSSSELAWSEGVYSIHGLDPVRFRPTLDNALAVYHADDVPRLAQDVEEAIRSGRSYESSARIIRSDGAVRDVLSRGLCETGPDGRVTALFGTIMDVTELRQAERSALASEARYRLLADNASDMITHMDLKGVRLFVSPGAREMVGYEPEDLVGTERTFFVHPDDEPNLKRKMDDIVAGRADRISNINRIRHKDGWWIWIEASVKLLRDAQGRPSGIVSALRDITDRKLADEALRESEKRYRLLAENSTDLIALKSSFARKRSYVSPSVSAMTGYTPDEFAALPISVSVHPEDRERIAAVFDALTSAHPITTALHRLRHKAGHWIWVETDFRLIDADGPGRTVLVRSRDVTVRHQAEEALGASEARYRALAETTSDVITQLDLNLFRRYVSPSCRTMLGYEQAEMLGVEPVARMHPEDTPAAVAVARRLTAGEIEGDRTTITYRSLHKAGHWVWLETVMTLVRDEATGAPTSLICSLRDVTERQRVARHLERAKEAAEAATVAKTEFVANMSHELRTPLAGIIGVHDLLRMDPGLSDAQRRLVNLAGDAGRSLLAIVNDVLDFSKVDAGQLSLESVPFDLDDLLTGCCDLARQQLHGKPVGLSLVRQPQVMGRYAGDPTRVRQVLLNLLTNAVKFTDDGRITVRAVYGEASGTLRVEITDTGIGIPPERIGSLFERFTQADTSTTRRYGGTGLGLAICKRLTDLMGGRIGADLVPEGGSSFWFELPLQRHHGSLTGSTALFGESRKTVGRTLLLAEDNAVNAEIIVAMLATRGYTVVHVPDGAQAVDAIRQGESAFDLILMDLQMPVMDGLSATAAIRVDEARSGARHRPIVGLTANALAEDAALCLLAGMDAHVAKPIDWADLFAVLDRLLTDPDTGLAAPDIDAELSTVLDIAKLEELSSVIGRERLGSMVDRFRVDLKLRLAAVLSGDQREQSSAVHVLMSTAGQLGFTELSRLCADADRQLRAGRSLPQTDEFRSAAERAEAAAARSGFAAVA